MREDGGGRRGDCQELLKGVRGDDLTCRAVRVDEENEVVVTSEFLFEEGEVDLERVLRHQLERRDSAANDPFKDMAVFSIGGIEEKNP